MALKDQHPLHDRTDRPEIQYSDTEGRYRLDNLEHGLLETDNVVARYIKKYIAFDFSVRTESGTSPLYNPTVDFTNPQRWVEQTKSSQKDLSENFMSLPIVAIERVGFDILHDRIPHWISDADLSHALYAINKASATDRDKVEYVMTRRPVQVEVQYDIGIICETVSQMNHLKEQFALHESKAWTWDTYHLIVKYSSGMDNNVIADQMSNRVISFNLPITVQSYVLPRENDKDRIDVKVIPTTAYVLVQENVLTSQEMQELFPELYPDPNRRSAIHEKLRRDKFLKLSPF
jgi:hypothetical protein